MNGAQALTAIVKPGGRLVSQEVAESIVRFVAGGSGFVNAEIEPSLELSLVCRELNTTRIAHGDAEISATLLAGSRDTILTEFYERALGDQPAGVRRVIEDDLLTESGYRESLAEERVRKALAAAGARRARGAGDAGQPPSAAHRGTPRHAPRRADARRALPASSRRAARCAASAKRATKLEHAKLAAQREREAASHRALVRARMIASVCAVLMIVAVASAAYGWISQRRAAHRRDGSAQVAQQKPRSSSTS